MTLKDHMRPQNRAGVGGDYGHMSAADLCVLNSLQSSTLTILNEVIGTGVERAAVLDYPRYKNAGDTLIWSGQMEYLARLGIDVRYVADIGRIDFAEMRRRVPEGPIFLQGGGNFGDLWPVFQNAREHIVRSNPNRRIVCFPQSVHFSSPELAKVTNDVFAAHGGVTVLVRDQLSLVRAHALMPDVDFRYCYDAALGNKPFARRHAPEVDVLALARQDRESTGSLSVIAGQSLTRADWDLSRVDSVLWAANRLPLAAFKRAPSPFQPPLQRIVDGTYARFTRLNLRNAVATLSQGRAVVTDRLHAHVLSILLGIPHVVVDNTYGKIRPIFDEYTHRFSTSHFASDAASALDGAWALLNAPEGR